MRFSLFNNKKLVCSIFCALVLTVSCKSVKYTESQIQDFNKLIENRNFTIESDWAYPRVSNAVQQVVNSGILGPVNTPDAINLVGNYNFLSVEGDSISSYLPYFGERQFNVGYGGGNSAIKLQGVMEDYKITKGKNNAVIIQFKASSEQESFVNLLRLYPNLNAEIQVNGNSRGSISYSGKVKRIEKK